MSIKFRVLGGGLGGGSADFIFMGARIFLDIYPLARNQYINNSPGIFSCIRAGADTCAACICTEINSPKIFLCIGTRDVRIQALYQYRGQGPKCEYIFQK